jgi:hypothetical protein
MDKNVNDSDNSPASNSTSPESVLTPPTQPLPKGNNKRTNAAKNVGSTKDSDPTM